MSLVNRRHALGGNVSARPAGFFESRTAMAGPSPETSMQLPVLPE